MTTEESDGEFLTLGVLLERGRCVYLIFTFNVKA